MIKVQRKRERESNESLIRRFVQMVHRSGVLREARGKRFRHRAMSKEQKRQAALYRALMHKEVERLKKMGRYNYMTVREARKRLKRMRPDL